MAQSVIDIIQTIARQRGRGDTIPLLMLRQIDGQPGERISHLPVDTDLAQAWLAMTGEPFRPHQAQALMGLRRGEPVALRAANPAVALTGYLMLYATLLGNPLAAGLVLAPDDETADQATQALTQINAGLPTTLRLPLAQVTAHVRPPRDARIVIATVDALHHRLLRHHDRGWSLLWQRLRLAMLLDLQHYGGVAGAHLADLLLRMQRVNVYHSAERSFHLLATLSNISEPQPALTALIGYPWRVISANDTPADPCTLALWRGNADRLRESVEVARAIQRQGYHVHIACQRLETAVLAPVLDAAEDISIGPGMRPAHVLVLAGYTGQHSALQRALCSGYQAVVVVLGDLPHEQMLARHPESLISDQLTIWPEPPANAYITAQHVLCAASELPLTEEEVESWGAQDIVARLVSSGQLVDLPDPEVVWKPTSAVGDPYAEFSLLSSSGSAILAQNEQGQQLDMLDPTGFERWTFLNAALPPGAGGMRVTRRIEENGSVILRLESQARRTYPLRRADVTLREERATRLLLNSKQIGWGRVVVEEEIYGYREMTATGAATDLALKPLLAARWIAPACWFNLNAEIQPLGQFVGWSLSAALELRALATFTDTVPCYDYQARRLYLVDAQPGGNGLAAWLYTNAEQVLPLAYDIALACRNDPLLEPLSRLDMDWLLALLGRRAEQPAERPRVAEPLRGTGHNEPPAWPQLIEGPPPAVPRIILTAAPDDAQAPDSIQPPADPAPDAQPTPRRNPSKRSTAHRRDERIRAGRASPAERPDPEATSAPPTPKALPDASSLIKRLQRQRQQREAELGLEGEHMRRTQEERQPAIEPRFKTGDQIFCLPYGDGIVRASWIDDGRELLTVDFPQHGELKIDPSVSLVRKIANASNEEDDLL